MKRLQPCPRCGSADVRWHISDNCLVRCWNCLLSLRRSREVDAIVAWNALTKEGVELAALLERAATHVMTPYEVWQQRVSFAFGNLPEESKTSREQIERSATEIYGACPAPNGKEWRGR